MTVRTADDRSPAAAHAVPGPPGVPTARRPAGAWPSSTAEALSAQARREHARRDLVLDSVRASLTEQPNASCVRSCARRWVADVLALAEDVAHTMTETE